MMLSISFIPKSSTGALSSVRSLPPPVYGRILSATICISIFSCSSVSLPI